MLLAAGRTHKLAREMGLTAPITVKNSGGYKLPFSGSAEDAEAVERAWAFNEAWFADPLFLTGDFPARVKNFTSTFLPEFTAEEKAMIKGSSDYFAYDAYTAAFYKAPADGIDACLANSSHPQIPSVLRDRIHAARGTGRMGDRGNGGQELAVAAQGDGVASCVPALHRADVETHERDRDHRVQVH